MQCDITSSLGVKAQVIPSDEIVTHHLWAQCHGYKLLHLAKHDHLKLNNSKKICFVAKAIRKSVLLESSYFFLGKGSESKHPPIIALFRDQQKNTHVPTRNSWIMVTPVNTSSRDKNLTFLPVIHASFYLEDLGCRENCQCARGVLFGNTSCDRFSVEDFYHLYNKAFNSYFCSLLPPVVAIAVRRVPPFLKNGGPSTEFHQPFIYACISQVLVPPSCHPPRILLACAGDLYIY